MTKKTPCDGEVKKCCSTLQCKSTAALQEQVEAEMDDEDKSLKDILNAKDDTRPESPSS